MEIIVPRQIETVTFKIEQLWDEETDEKIDHINPGVAGQGVKVRLPIRCQEGWILRRKK